MAESRKDGQGRSRTADTRIFSPLLYHLSYLAGAEKYNRPTLLLAGFRDTLRRGVLTPALRVAVLDRGPLLKFRCVWVSVPDALKHAAGPRRIFSDGPIDLLESQRRLYLNVARCAMVQMALEQANRVIEGGAIVSRRSTRSLRQGLERPRPQGTDNAVPDHVPSSPNGPEDARRHEQACFAEQQPECSEDDRGGREHGAHDGFRSLKGCGHASTLAGNGVKRFN
jgi:hypothetical protein